MKLLIKILALGVFTIVFTACRPGTDTGEDQAQGAEGVGAEPDQPAATVDDGFVRYLVQLVPQGNGILKVNDPNGKCKKQNHAGCLLFRQDTRGSITFHLPGFGKKSDNCQGNAQKVITKIELTTNAVENDPAKGDFTGNLSAWIKNSAFNDVDLGSGIIYQANSPDEAWTQRTLTNLNSHDAQEGEKQFWYRVTATKCGEPETTWVTDPRGDNEGLN